MSELWKQLPKELTACALCGTTRYKPLFEKDGREFARCVGCGLVYLRNRLTADAHKAFYAPGVARWTTHEEYEAEKYDHFVKLAGAVERIMPRGRLLDVGCGIGLFIKIAGDRGWSVHGCDISPADIEYARKHWHLDVSLGDIRQASPLAESFDVITMWDFLEHVHDPVACLQEAHRLMRPAGRIFMLTGNVESEQAQREGKNWAFFGDGSHVVFYSLNTMRRLLALAGLSEDRAAGQKYYADGQPNLGRRVVNALKRLALRYLGRNTDISTPTDLFVVAKKE